MLTNVAFAPSCGRPQTEPGAETASAAEDKIDIGHPAALSGKYAKAAEQTVGSVQAAVDWVDNSCGGVDVGATEVPLEYTFYDCESRKESVASLLERLIYVMHEGVIKAEGTPEEIRQSDEIREAYLGI